MSIIASLHVAFKLSSRSYVLGPLRIPCDVYDCTKIMIIMNMVIKIGNLPTHRHQIYVEILNVGFKL